METIRKLSANESKYFFSRSIHIILVFIFFVQIGCSITEFTRLQVAKSLNYSGEYVKPFARNLYSSPEVQLQFRNVISNNPDDYKSTLEYINLVEVDQADHAKIDLFSILINIIISIIGSFLFLLFRKIEKKFSWKQLISILFGMFYLRDGVIYLLGFLVKGLPCNEAKIWHYFNLPVFTSMAIYIGICAVCLLFQLILIPSVLRVKLMVCGCIGSFIGLGLWGIAVGPMLFG